MCDTGDVRKWNLPGRVIDKHSTGGIGDNVSLILARMLVHVVHMFRWSRAGLGHTGGTVDKLESIPGYRTQISGEEFEKVVTEIDVPLLARRGLLLRISDFMPFAILPERWKASI